jgi:hypothetical protein
MPAVVVVDAKVQLQVQEDLAVVAPGPRMELAQQAQLTGVVEAAEVAVLLQIMEDLADRVSS